MTDEKLFGFTFVETDPWTRIGQAQVEEYQSCTQIMPAKIPLEKIIPDAAQEIGRRADRLIEARGWKSVRVVISVALRPE